MAENGRVHPKCVNAANPYHECGVACLEKLQGGKGRKDKKRPDFQIGVGKKKDGGRTHSSCPKASNPYHNCDEFCSYANPQGVKKQSGSILQATLSFGRKKKGPEPQPPKSPQKVSNASPPSPLPAREKVESDSSHSSSSSSSSQQPSNLSQDRLVDKGQVQPAGSVPLPGHLKLPDHQNGHSNGSVTSFEQKDKEKPQATPRASPVASPRPSSFPFISDVGKAAEQKAKEKPQATPRGTPRASPISSPRPSSFPFISDGGKVSNDPVVRAMNYNSSGISHASGESDEEDRLSVVSDSCASVGPYHVRRSVASTLQLIFSKYGDIAENSRLESSSMRAYYLEGLCSVVQELQSTAFKQLTKSKLKEMLAVLKDVESAQIDVSWLRNVLSEVAQAMELNAQHDAAEIAKAECDDAIESTRNELESLTEDLARKEKAAADARAQVTEAKSRFKNLELESSKWNHTISSIWSKVEKFHSKPLADELL